MNKWTNYLLPTKLNTTRVVSKYSFEMELSMGFAMALSGSTNFLFEQNTIG